MKMLLGMGLVWMTYLPGHTDLLDELRRNAFSYRSSFTTKAGEKTTLRLRIADFVATSFGRRIPGAPPIQPGRIQSVGFTLADQKPGPFRLDVLKVDLETAPQELDSLTEGQQVLHKALRFGVPLYIIRVIL